MKKTPLYVIITLSFLLLGNKRLFAQDWVKMMNDPSVNVHDVQKAFYDWYEKHHTETLKKGGATVGKDEEEEQGYQLFKRWEHYALMRSQPNGSRVNSKEVASEYKEFLKNKQPHKATNVSNWQYVGNISVPVYGGDGRVNRTHFYPGNSNTIYATSPAGGLWVSNDGGNTWATKTDQLINIGTGDLAINPLNPSIMYLSTGDNDAGGTFTPLTTGVLRSSDGGNTWDSTGMNYSYVTSGNNYMSIAQLIFNPADTGTLFSATSFGLFYTKNGGKSWTKAINDNIKDVEFEPYHSSTVYAGSFTGAFYRSVDSGKTFTRITAGLPTKGMERMAIGTTNADSNLVYLLAVDSANYGFYGIYLSSDRGQTFRPKAVRSTGAPNLLGWSNTGSDSSGQAWYNLVIKVSPTHADSVFVAGSWLWESADSGATWNFNNNVYNNVHIDIHSITFFPGSSEAFLMSTDGGVFETPDAGNTWTNMSNNLAIAEQYSIGLSADNPYLFITGWQDNSCNISSPNWESVFGGDGMTCFIDYTTDNTMYASSENGNFGASFDGGNTWNTITNGITETGDWDTPWLEDPMNSSTLFAGFKNVWESGDQGGTWTPISTWGGYYINALAVAPSNDQFIYAAEYYAIYSTQDGGTTWTNITGSLPVSYASISGIAVDPNNPLRVWVTFSGWAAGDKVFETSNGGKSWINISAGLPNLPANCAVYQNGTPDGVYVGTDVGVYYKDSTMTGWIPYNIGLPNVEVFDLKIYAPQDLLLAATYGRGTWQTPTFMDVGINNITISDYVKVYPNPAHGSITVSFDMPAPGKYSVSVSNVLGQNVYSDNVNVQGKYTAQINAEGFEAGMYFVTIAGNNAKTVKKVVVY